MGLTKDELSLLMGLIDDEFSRLSQQSGEEIEDFENRLIAIKNKLWNELLKAHNTI